MNYVIDPNEIETHEGGPNWWFILTAFVVVGFWAVIIIEIFNLV